ncbi:Signal transduction histidine kinase [Mucilaginibacter pineti]|uniref:histidine kinase n=1 Tax=Mucilaginibacter pineti TaxID=1391627 RepID=A0A1G6XHX5_9SPHI|nr:HAMP domain-containing sensor histidine kinase [Mucilaginibacter pineti]SDD77672.1 Signal transduction histidine kinase [Mucilaginibacter pineti]
MKLSTHYNKASVVISVSVLVVGAIVYFFTINYISQKQFDSDLGEEVSEVLEYINFHHQLPKPTDFDEDQTSFVKTDHTHFDTRFFDTVYTASKNKIEDGRAVEAMIPFNNQHYKMVIVISKESTQYLVQIITIITLGLMATLLLVIFLTNRYILSDLWQPFYNTLSEIKLFNVSDSSKFKSTDSKVDEFKELNVAVQEMSGRAKNDFQNLKHFTENASHEMLTPLAVITTKLDILIQDENLTDTQLNHIRDIYSSINKSTRLNQSLLLLIKIDNHLINDEELINLKGFLISKAMQFQELMRGQNIDLSYKLIEKQVSASKYLLDILLNNLLSNAIKHNHPGGKINITLYNNQLIIKNTGKLMPLAGDVIFDRFYKGSDSQGTGLGLTLVKNICQYHQYDVSYAYAVGRHAFTITFES